jgi:hypothetical protein
MLHLIRIVPVTFGSLIRAGRSDAFMVTGIIIADSGVQ